MLMKRIIKSYNQSIGPNYTQVPTILLKGQWLRKAGFESGEYVEVQVDGDKITLTKTEVPEKAEKASLEEKVKNLDKKQREKLSKLIDEL